MLWPRSAGRMADLLLFGWDEAQHEDIALAAVVALEDGLAEGGVTVERDLFAFGPARQTRTQNIKV
jgi:hypothetical protein